MDLEFKIDTTFLVGNDSDRHQISIQPMSGVISAESELELKLEVTPKYGGEETFLVKCIVKRCKMPLKLHVHVDTFTVLPCLIHEISSKQRTELHHSKMNRITLDNMLPRIPQSLTFVLLNMGKPSFIYTWEENEDQIKRSKIELCFSRRTGVVTSQSREYISINITVLSKVTFKDVLVSLKISKGPQYNILFSGTGEIPSYEFSFSEYNFGPHFLCNRDAESSHKTLLYVTNRDEDPIIVETLFDNNEVFQLNIPSNGIVKPRGQIEILITFRPKEQKKYREDVVFTINGLFNHKVTICGYGYHSKMVLAKLSDKLVNFGAVLVGQTVTKSINLLNKCPAAGDVYLTTVPSESIPFTFEPSESELMKPHGNIKFYFTYSPTTLMKPFTVQVYMNSVDMSEPLCIVKGSAIGPSFCLDRDYIPFGCVIVGCSSSVKFILLNNGDIGSKFAWDCNKPLSWTAISPSCGYISPGSEIKFIVKFTPDCAVSYFRKEVLCNIDAYNKPLKLVLTGSSIAAPPPTETIQFSCPVRKSDHKTINIHNSQGEMWTVYPIFKGEGFAGSQTITINSMNDAVYEIAYSPVSMTSTSLHQGTLFFPFPDGTCKLYGLIGEATPPEAEDSFLWRIPAKVNVTQEVTLINWLTVSQRFEMTNDIDSQESYNLVFSINGVKYTDVGPSQSRKYYVTLHSYKEGKVKVKLYFTNEISQEYIWFDIAVIVDPPLPLADLTMKTRIRNSVKQSIPLINSLPEPVSFNFTSNIPFLVAEESTLTIEGGQKGVMVLIYSPLLLQEEKTEIIVIASEQLGDFLYRVDLIAEEPVPEKTVILSAEIGRNTVVPLTVVNKSPSKAEFSCEPDHPSLSITSKIAIETEQTGELSLTFEPTEEGTITKCLKVHSDTAGTFYFPVIANGCLPKPRGPYIIKQGHTIDFVIKNVFNTPKKYKCFVDSSAFVVKNPEFTIQPKKEAKIQVSMVKNHDLYPNIAEFPVTGKLQVLLLHGSSQTLLQSQNVYNGQFTWTYYLKGISDISK